jgi:hypothetical protein
LLFGLVKLVVCLLCSGRVMLLAGAWFGVVSSVQRGRDRGWNDA